MRKIGQSELTGTGFHPNVTIQLHRGSIPALPVIGEALGWVAINMTIPMLQLPDDAQPGPGDDDPPGERRPRFIKDATV